MMKNFEPELHPAMPQHPHGIGIIGAGGIVQHGHMPAYRKAGWNVVAIASRTEENVARTAREWDIPCWHTDWRALMDMPAVTVLDVTYPFDEERLAIVGAAAACGKHVMMQKPLAHSMAAVEEMVRLADEGGIFLAVNQNARWCPQYRAAREVIAQGLLGDVYFFIHEMQNTQDSQSWFTGKWYAQQPRFQILEYSVHHLDLARFWLGQEPVRVTASTARKPGQTSKGEMIAAINLEFPGHALGVIVDNNASFPQAQPRSRFRIEGTRGMLEGEAMGQPSFNLYSDMLSESPLSLALPGNWFPDAFIGTMAELLCAIEQNQEPSISGHDNLKTMKLVFDAYSNIETA